MRLVNYRQIDPWKALEEFHDEINKFFVSPFAKFPSLKKEFLTPLVDVWEDKDAFHLEAEMPGFEQKDIELKVKDGTLILSAKKDDVKQEKEKSYCRCERSQGGFYRAIGLPSLVDSSKAKAAYKKGVLKITLPKKKNSKEADIKIALNKK